MIFYTNRIMRIALLLIAGIVSLNSQIFAQGTWTPITINAPHGNAGVMLLMTDGRVLCKSSAGGGQGKIWDILTPDINGSYTNGTWTSTAPMIDDRLYFSSQVLRDGRVYVCGGEYGSGGSIGEVYNLLTNTWTACPSMGFFVSDANSMLLDGGKVLQACVGSGTRHTRLWDPATNTYSLGPDCLRTNNEAPWLKLPDNSIVFIDNYATTSERYIPATNTWINDGTVPVDVYDPYGDEAGSAFMLPNGKGFFIGSSGHNALYTPTGTLAPGTWTAAADIPGPSGTPDAASAMMVTGNVLLAVSPLPTSGDHFPSPTTFYEYNYLTNSFTLVGTPGGGPSLPVPSYYTNMLDLPDGTVMYGTQGDTRYYTYTPSGAPLAAGKPTLNNILRVSCDTFTATGTLFNGISGGAGYGDDWQMDTNYPLIRIHSGANVYYARTFNWNSTGVQRGSAPDTVTFKLPPGMPGGVYTIEVVVNGIASTIAPFDTSLAITPGTATTCAGSGSTTFTTHWPGGVWSTANPAIATVGSSTGVVTGVAAGTTTVTYTFGTCFSIASVTVIAGPAAITPLGGANVCEGSTTTLNDATPAGTWSSGSVFNATVTSLGVVTGVNAGLVNITYTIPATGCYTVEPVTVNAAPGAVITLGGPTTFCPGNTVVLSANTGAGYTYQWSVGGSPIGGATNSTYTASASGNYTVNVSNATGCTSVSASVTVTLLTAPPATITPAGPTSVCAGSTVVLNANTGVGLTYQWQVAGIPIGGATLSSYTASGSGNYTVVVTNLSGCSTTSAVTAVTINPLPSLITGTAVVCVGATTTLSDVDGPGTWTSSDITVATVGSTTGVVTGMGTGGFATITYTLGTGCTTSIVVTVNSFVAAPITGPSSVCAGQNITLADGTPGGVWSSGNVAIATVGTSGVVTGVSGGPVTISYVATSGCGTATATKTITVNPLPVVASITGTLTVCSGASTTLTDATPSGTWSSSNPAVASIGTGGVVTAVSIGTSNISYTVTNGFGCTDRATALFTVFSPLSAVITPEGPTSFCTGGFVVLDGPAGGTSYQWKRGGVNIAGATSGTYTASTSGVYTVLITLTGGCSTMSSSTTVTVNPSPIVPPAVSITATVGPIFCITTAPTTLTAVPVNGGFSPTYQWIVNGVSVGAGNTYSYTPTAGDIVKVVLTSSDACAFPLTASATDTMTVSPLRTPSVTIRTPHNPICDGDTAMFIAMPVYGGTAPVYHWTENGINVATGPEYIYTPHNGDLLVVTLFSNYPCLVTNTAVSPTYTVHTQAAVTNSVTIFVTQSTIVAGSVDTFIAVATNGGTLPSYQWLLNGLPIPGATNSMYITGSLENGQVISCMETSNAPCANPLTAKSGGIAVTVKPGGVGVPQVNGKQNSFTLVPNPNKGEFTVSGTINTLTDERVSIVITDMLGQAVYRYLATATNGNLNTHITLDKSIANGIYLVSITSGDGHEVYHIVIDK
jgi:uncharacterized protein YjdB